MIKIWQAAVGEFEQGRDCVVATILSVRGSSPRHVGTRFLIRADLSTVSTIGGGLFEAQVHEMAQVALKNRMSYRSVFAFTGPDAGSSQMICGGEVDVLLEFLSAQDPAMKSVYQKLLSSAEQRHPALFLTSLTLPSGGATSESLGHLVLDGDGSFTGGFPGEAEAVKSLPEPRLLKPAQVLSVSGLEHPVLLEWLHPESTVYIFGGGHVGVTVAHLASYVNFRVVVLDDREEFVSPERFPSADELIVLNSFPNAFAGLQMDGDSYVVIVTRGHSQDKTVLADALKTPAGYIGMIGSRRKNHLIFQSLLAEGFGQEDLDRVHAPIGLPIGGETPEEIGVSIVAQMIQVRFRKLQADRGARDSTGCGTCAG